MKQLVLASASPRRREILGNLGLSFEVQPADIEETRAPGELPSAYVARLAREKAQAVARTRGADAAVLAADTTVVLDDHVLEKPRDRADSERMLRLLRGRTHQVHTGVCLLLWPERALSQLTVTTAVRFRDFDDATLRGYVASGEGLDKAGSYGIQALGQALVSEIHGSYTNVVGLPAAETIELLLNAKVLEAWP
ncbi:MAG TPA: Maf family protein [Polyangiales bacterium]